MYILYDMLRFCIQIVFITCPLSTCVYVVINCTLWDLTFMNLQSCTRENKLCCCLKLLSSNYKPTGPQLASVHFHAIFVHFLYFRENWTWIKLVPSTRQNMWQTHQKTRERERKRYLVSIQIMVIIYWAVSCSITHKIHNSVFELKTCSEVTISVQNF